MVLIIFCLPFNNVNVIATHPKIDSNKAINYYYRHNLETNTTIKISTEQLPNQVDLSVKTSVTEKSYNCFNSPEYVPEHLSKDIPSETDNRALLGSWTEINPATSGEYRNTVYISYTRNGQRRRASGFMIGPAAVATAGHALYSDGHYATNIVITPAKANDSAPYGSANGVFTMLPVEWTDDEDSNYDWGIIELSSNIGDNVGWLGLETKTSSYNNKSIRASGYPGKVGGQSKYTLYRTTGTICSSATHLLYSDDTNLSGGMSGGPLYYYNSNYGYTAIGIIIADTSSRNIFVRFDSILYDVLLSYRNFRA